MYARKRSRDGTALLALLSTWALITLLPGCASEDDGPSPPDIAEALASMDGVLAFDEIPSSSPAYRLFQLRFAQPVDHGSPDSPIFGQYLTLVHRSYDAPMVLATTGYHNYLFSRLTEPAYLLDANQIVVEHRYFGTSRPVPVDWTHLTIEQAAADHHRIVEAFAPLYGRAWISTGASKGGMTSVFHRRFYPDDVDATIAYVAPITFDVSDPRYESFFDRVGQEQCRQQIRALQREALDRREALERLASDFAALVGYTFTRLGGIDRALEAGIVELEWAFWQYMGLAQCDQIPDRTADDQTLFTFLIALDAVGAMSDQTIEVFEPYYYQSFTQLGYPSVPTGHLADLLQFEYESDLNALMPAGATATYDPGAMQDIADWVASEGERLLFVYGENDPWTGGAFELGSARDSYLFVVPAGNHGSKLADLLVPDASLALEALRHWTGVTPRPLPPRRLLPPMDRYELLPPPPGVH